MTRTYLDWGVLIAATRNTELSDPAAVAILNDPGRSFASSDFVRLEVIPKAVYHRKAGELLFYEGFLAAVAAWASPLDEVTTHALRIATAYGLAGMDALHVASALITGTEEFITTERPALPLHRVREIAVVSIHPLALQAR